MIRSDSYSRYKKGTLVKDVGGDWLVPKARGFDTRARPDDRFHTVKQEERLDLIAHRYLGDARLFWVIALYNNIFWMLDLKMGQELRIPSYDTLMMDILV